MGGRLAVGALAVSAVLVSSALGYGAEVRERMVVRNLAPPALEDSTRVVLARDVAAGAGIFEYSEGPFGFGWPMVVAGNDSFPYNIAMLDTGGRRLSRIRIPAWGSWDSVFEVAGAGAQPMFETHNIASSPVSQKVCITWVRTDTSPMPGFYRISTDGGANWNPVQEFARPPGYGGDTVTSFHVSSLFPFYDDSDRLHIAAAVHPVVHDTGFITPAEIWHWCPDFSPSWRLIRRAGCAPEHLLAPVGYNALYACRPSVCALFGDAVFMTWEQFDSANVDPQTNLLRAGIHVCVFEGGAGYMEAACITSPGQYSCRFPFPARVSDSAWVVYELDQVAGFAPLGQGPPTNNLVVVQRLLFLVSTTHIELGRLDTIGGTTYDLQCCGPARRSACFAPGYGTHALWMRSADLTGSYWDLDMCYNFCDTAAYSWSWIDPDYMQSGVNVFPYRTGAGCMACEPATGVAVVSGYAPPILPPVAVKEMPSAECRMPNAGPTIMSGAEVQGLSSKVVFDALGRRALNPASGVYFVREQSVVSSQHSGTEHGARNTEYDGRLRKVVLTE